MPYNTRRKSLSLPSLGIHVPTSKSSTSRPSPCSAVSTKSSRSISSSSPLSITTLATPDDSQPEPCTKKAKRSHSRNASMVSRSLSKISITAATPHTRMSHATPPPSPGTQRSIKKSTEKNDDRGKAMHVDLRGINDEIVECVIVCLRNTRNRPHLAQELADFLASKVKLIQQSSNPSAIVSSHLSAYLERPGWSAAAPCPLTKGLETVHPRRTYFYLSGYPHLPLPDPTPAQLAQRSIITPSLSSSASISEDADSTEVDRRRELSLSPEVDLSSPEFDDVDDEPVVPGNHVGSVMSRRRAIHSFSRNPRTDEPPLEKDEKEFTQTADGLHKRKLTGELMSKGTVVALDLDDGLQHEQLFGEHKGLLLASTFLPHLSLAASPAMRPSFTTSPKKDNEAENWAKLDVMLGWDRNPETVELDEIDSLFDNI